NPDRDEFDRRALLDFLDHEAQMLFEIVAGVDRKRRIIDRRAVGNHHQYAALLWPREKTPVCPIERLAVDVFLEQAFAHHQPEMFSRSPPRRVRGFVNDVAKIVEAAWRSGFVRLQPGFTRLAALPRAGREAEDFDLDAATLQCAGQNIGAGSGNRNRTATHRAGIIDEQGHYRIAELHILLTFEG